jgi:hypothetical protein
MSKAGISLKYFTPAIKPRIRPTFKPRITATGISGVHFAPRVLPTPLSGIKPSLGGGVSGLSSPAKIAAPKIKSLLTQTHTGRPPASNPQSATKAKSPSQQTGYSSHPPSTKLPSSAVAQRPGIHSLQGAKMQIHKSNPLRIPKVKSVF